MVFDTFCFFNECDLLELRLNILDPYVDYFVLLESEETFSGHPKPTYYLDNQERFAKWHHKIIHGVTGKIEVENAFLRAAHQKDNLRKGLAHASDEDIVYFGDLDEIWTPQEITDDKVYNLRQLNYSYYLNNRSSEEWIGTIVGKWKTVKTKNLNYWRANHTNILDGGWHFSNIGGVEQIIKKIEAYDHQEYNLPIIKDHLKQRMDLGVDYLGREKDYWGKPFEFKIDESQWPIYLKENKEKYIHLCK